MQFILVSAPEDFEFPSISGCSFSIVFRGKKNFEKALEIVNEPEARRIMGSIIKTFVESYRKMGFKSVDFSEEDLISGNLVALLVPGEAVIEFFSKIKRDLVVYPQLKKIWRF